MPHHFRPLSTPQAFRPLFIAALFVFMTFGEHLLGQVPDTDKLQMVEWAANGMTKDPVALSFDHRGRLYVVETARRSTVDIDMRAHRTWLLDDLASDDFESMRDFFQRQMATSRSANNKDWLQDRNGDGVHDYRDLREVSERIRLIEDTDNDGTADRSTLYAEGFNEEFNGVAAGVMPYQGDVFVTVYPDLWRLRDTDGDRKADKREIVFRGFGVHAAFDGHDLHGLTVGPEGKIYFSCGDNGFSIITKEGKRLHYPNTGGVLRMDPDGSNLEVYAYGLRNVQEIDFDQYGNMFAVDNDGDLEDERERAVYIAEGSDSGWRLNWQFRAEGWKQHNGGMTYNPWTAEEMWKPQHPEQPANITPPMQNYSVGPGGFKFNPGTALNDEYRDFFFCVQFPVQKITAFRTKSKGAGFEMVDEHTFNSGLMVSSVNFGPDGGCYLADWIGKWAPNNEGIIYRVDDPAEQGSVVRREVQAYINYGVAGETNDNLLALLGHADRRVRHLAQSELVHRDRGLELLAYANRSSNRQLGRVHALWGLIQWNDSSFNARLANELPWSAADAQIRQQCAKVAGDLELAGAEPHLVKLLSDNAPLVRSHAAIALGRTGTSAATGPLIEMLARNADLDPFIRHACVVGLAGVAKEAQLIATSEHGSSSARLGAALALSRKKSSRITAFLSDSDTRVLREAVRAIHDDFSIPDALPAIAELLDSNKLPTDEPILRRLISANFRIGSIEAANRLVRFISNTQPYGDLTDALKLEAMECLAKWNQTPIVDRVEGRIRKGIRPDLGAGRRLLAKNVSSILETGSPSISAAALRHINELRISIDATQFRGWVTSTKVTDNARIDALRLLHDSQDEQASTLVDQIVRGKHGEKGDSLWRFAYSLLLHSRPDEAMQRLDFETKGTGELQFYISLLSKFANSKADAVLTNWVKKQREVSARGDLMLDVLQAAKERGKRIEGLAELEAAVAQEKHGAFAFALTGGNAERGEHLYKSHPSAQCIRCHNAGGEGQQAGPVLNKIGQQQREYLLEALIDPNAAIAKGFESTTVLKEDGKMITGTVVSENDEVIMIGATNKTYKIRKGEIEERTSAKTSAMPKITDVLTPHEVRDLVEYLTTLK